jgi:hypothetical protein
MDSCCRKHSFKRPLIELAKPAAAATLIEVLPTTGLGPFVVFVVVVMAVAFVDKADGMLVVVLASGGGPKPPPPPRMFW